MPPIVLDTNTLLSAALFPNSIVNKAYKKARNNFQIVLSSKIWAEATEVFKRPKFDKYVGLEYRLIFLEALRRKALFIEPTETITDCRDPKDDKYLELGVACNAQFIVTGDINLLVLNPYRGITILKSGDFLALELA